ncbi:MAG: VanW family protein [Clostridia bacterium]|nr:VanW family protein [Clostridia bacterium]
MFGNKLFCELSPTAYAISVKKEIYKRRLTDKISGEKFAKTKTDEKLPFVVATHCSNMIKRAPGVDLTLQFNKADNIRLACAGINGIVVKPGETFSFWQLVGNPSKKNGFKEGRVIHQNKIIAGLGGGLCNLSNTVHLMILESPMTVTEFHTHSDALAPDPGKRVPLSAGTSVSYNNVDFRFKNNTDQAIQLLMWCDGEDLKAELRSEREFDWCYEIVEEDHHFAKEGDKFFRVSKIFRAVKDRKTGKEVGKELIWDNHSEVMFDYDLIPEDQIR